MSKYFHIRIAGCRAAHAKYRAQIGRFLSAFHPTKFGPGRYVAKIETCADPADALAFASEAEAELYWRQEVGPPRPDGKANRPLMAWDIEVTRPSHPESTKQPTPH